MNLIKSEIIIYIYNLNLNIIIIQFKNLKQITLYFILNSIHYSYCFRF